MGFIEIMLLIGLVVVGLYVIVSCICECKEKCEMIRAYSENHIVVYRDENSNKQMLVQADSINRTRAQ